MIQNSKKIKKKRSLASKFSCFAWKNALNHLNSKEKTKNEALHRNSLILQEKNWLKHPKLQKKKMKPCINILRFSWKNNFLSSKIPKKKSIKRSLVSKISNFAKKKAL